jgi:hypothetical protein
VADSPKPCEVLHEGVWVPGEVLAWRRGLDDDWRALVRYSVDLDATTLSLPLSESASNERTRFTFDQWRPATDVRRPTHSA